MRLDFDRAGTLLQEFELRKLFVEEIGWDRPAGRPTLINVDDAEFTITPVAEKRSVQIFECVASDDFPGYATRQRIERQIRRMAHEHLVIYTDRDRTRQVWQWSARTPAGSLVYREHAYRRHQSPLAMLQKLEPITFVIDDEDGLTLLDVTSPLKLAFDKEIVTKRFYDRFKSEHSSFLRQIQGIEGDKAEDDSEWYASLMLNRLMFVYFIQKKGFLDGDVNYLRNKLNQVNSLFGAGQFLSFYRGFLLQLFHEGLGDEAHSQELEELLGDIPYMNGGLFDVHELERKYPEIEIPDQAFEKLFDFFDAYQWHLDDRPTSTGNEINPDVLGYIFEKYINQKQMGAYYTKEDITNYMVSSTIVPWLLNQLQPPHALEDGQSFVDEMWDILAADPERYLFPALLTETALPTESAYELSLRHARRERVLADVRAGRIRSAADAITANINLLQLLLDSIAGINDPACLLGVLDAVDSCTVLDPTCGSGAFLFAALDVLEPITEACMARADAFLIDEAASQHEHALGHRLAVMNRHSNQRYFILKSIIVNNLYGVDIMGEAVEVCKLRLFLKLVSQVEDVTQLEPLPDIDFNIRCGNTLVGYLSDAELQSALGGTLDLEGTAASIRQKAESAAEVFSRFREAQLRGEHGPAAGLKARLSEELGALRDELDRRLYSQQKTPKSFDAWLTDAQPFHWLVEFNDIMSRGGFDIVVGNPPYVEYSKVIGTYRVHDLRTESCGNLYAYVVERSELLLHRDGRTSMIIPHSAFCTDRMAPLMQVLDGGSMWVSYFGIRPAKLFNGVDQRLAIYLRSRAGDSARYSTRYHHWQEPFRPVLFELVHYLPLGDIAFPNSIPKLQYEIEADIWRKLAGRKQFGQSIVPTRSAGGTVYFHNAPRYWIRATDFVPYFWNERDGEKPSTQLKALGFGTQRLAKAAAAILNSTLFFWWFLVLSDCRHLNRREIDLLPVSVGELDDSVISGLAELADALMADLKSNSNRKECVYKATGRVIYDEFFPRASKPIIDEIDRLLCKALGLTELQTDFIIRYELKFRTDEGE